MNNPLSSSIFQIPEIAALDGRRSLIRIPAEIDVPLTDRTRRIIDTADFRRLTEVSQLGLVSLVYPAANHTRFEHALGVYRLALLYLRQMAGDRRFAEIVTVGDAETFIAAALLHDLGHWPFCHAIEDMNLPVVPPHERFANSFLLEGEIATALREDWKIEPSSVVALLSEKPPERAPRILQSMLSGPIDIDKMDYLQRDSLHAGVPYGRHFDQARLLGSLCLNRKGDGLAITNKGKTAAELMVFARYVMFSEVYWHHAVRSATAMLQRAFFTLIDRLDLDTLFRQTEREMIGTLLRTPDAEPANELLDGLFGPVRRLYKRVAQFSFVEDPEIYPLLRGRPFPWLVRCAENYARLASVALGETIESHEILFDAPPAAKEVQFDLEVHQPKANTYRTLGEVSPVVLTLANEQFDDYVKRVRIYAHPRIAPALQNRPDITDLLTAAIEETD